MVERRLKHKDKIPIVLDISLNHFTVGLAGNDCPEKSFDPKGNYQNNSLMQLYKYVFNEDWGIDLQDRAFFIVEPTNINNDDRKDIAKIIFNDLNSPYIAFLDRGQSIHIYTGRHTSFIVESTKNNIITTPIKGINRFSDASLIVERGGGTNLECDKIINIIYNTIMRCPKETYVEFFDNIFLCGEYSNKEGIAHKIMEGLKKFKTEDLTMDIRVIIPQEIPYCGWIGGSIVAIFQ